MNKEDTKQAILGFTEFFKGITGNQDLKIPDDIAKKYEIEPNKWIPVSERLPEEDGEYLATIYDMDENHEYMDIAELENGKWCYKSYILVKAWMPLPQPYKAESEEEK
jgi:hypothetical protein